MKFIELRKIAFLISGSLIAFALFNIFGRKINWGIDFTGGTVVQVRFEKNENIAQIRKSLRKLNPVIQEFPKTNSFILKFSRSLNLTDLHKKLMDIFSKDMPKNPAKIERFEMVGPVVGKFLIKAALYAFLGALFGIIVYVAIRFKGNVWGLAAVIALIHDITITFGIMCFTGRSIDLIIVTGLLFIAGYSVNDTIVIYDRIRENLKKAERKKTSEIFNVSITQTLSRTIITSLTTLLVVLALFLFGGQIIHDFSLTLLIGIIIGTYSSIFIASPLVYISKKNAKK